MTDQDPWFYPRAELSAEVFQMFDTGLVRRMALFAPRRKGKTWFLIRDLAPAAVKKGFVPVYASLWAAPDAPHLPVIDALEDVVKTLSAKRVGWKRYLAQLQTVALNAGVVSASWTPGKVDPLPASTDELSRITVLIGRLVNLAPKRSVLLMIDEAQHLASDRRFSGLTHSLRTALDTIEAQGTSRFHTLFTGSSRTNLSRLLNDPGAPFYQSVEQIDLPDLDENYTNFVCSQLKRFMRGLKLTREQCWDAFDQLDRSPYYMELAIRALMLRRAEAMPEAVEGVLDRITNDPELSARWRSLRDLEQIIYLDITTRTPMYSEAQLALYSDQLNRPVDVADVQNALRRLVRVGLISKASRGEYRNEDPELILWARHKNSKDLCVPKIRAS